MLLQVVLEFVLRPRCLLEANNRNDFIQGVGYIVVNSEHGKMKALKREVVVGIRSCIKTNERKGGMSQGCQKAINK